MREIARSPWVRVAALAAVGALALSACSSSDSTSTETSAAAEPTAAASSAAASHSRLKALRLHQASGCHHSTAHSKSAMANHSGSLAPRCAASWASITSRC